jgi:hypothetical protein
MLPWLIRVRDKLATWSLAEIRLELILVAFRLALSKSLAEMWLEIG